MEAEIAVAMFDSPNPNGVKVGDIVVARKKLGHIGFKESKLFLWMVVEIDNEDDLALLSEPEYTDETRETIVKKRQYQIELAEISKEIAGFDSVRAQDKDDTYQPGINLDEVTGKYTTVKTPAKPVAVIRDKKDGRPVVLRPPKGP